MNTLDKIYYSKPYRFVADWRLGRKNVVFAKEYTKSHITPEQRKSVIEFYKPYTKVNTVFHDFYTEKSGRFDVRYIPDDLYYCKIDKFYNNWHDAPLFENKCFFQDMFSEARQPVMFAYKLDNYWFTGDRHVISYQDLLKLVAEENELVVKKATDSAGGRGVTFVQNDAETSIVEAFQHCVSSITGDIVVQYPIRQHEDLNRVCSSSVNSIRILSLLQEKDVKICSVLLRMGKGSNRVDNVSSGGFCCGIQADGRLNPTAFTKYGEFITEHPSSGVKLADVVVPSVDKAKDLISELHWRVPRFRLVSWDISIGEDGLPILLEANLSYGGVWIHQMNNGPVFGDDTERVLREVFGKRSF